MILCLRRCWFSALCFGFLHSGHGFAAVVCEPQANTPYESAFCRVKQSAHGKGLPSLADFRRNSQKMQYLLLRKPAAKLGLKLLPPADNASPKASKKSVDRPVLPQQSTRSSAPVEITQCSTAVDHIRCGQRIFTRLQNQSNKHLRPGALSKSNRLLLSPSGVNSDEAAYLLAAYVQYLNKMNSIGLAGSTSSYSAFAHTYYEHQRNGSDFVERYRSMFELLKQDKKNIGVSQRTPTRPPGWQECERLNSELIACYSSGINLVYQASR